MSQSNLKLKLILPYFLSRKFNALSSSFIYSHTMVRKYEINNFVNKFPISKTTNFVGGPFRWIDKSFTTDSSSSAFGQVKFEKVCDETLESLCEYFEELIEKSPNLQAADVNYGSGVLTVNFGSQFGTYVINRQSPNQQIWLSSPVSGPKRYDFVTNGNCWIYKHDNTSLHQLLQNEIKRIAQTDIDFSNCAYSYSTNK